jgi:uncharacterized membrane protein YgcG
MRRLCRLAFVVGLLLWAVTPDVLLAQRELRWDALDVDAKLDADGVLEVAERHTMVFSGDWNGGERVFNIRPRQSLEFLGLERIDARTGSPRPLQKTSALDNVDEFTWTDSRTLRWRSRLPSDPPFANTLLEYVLRYKLSGILFKDDAQYWIDHDFAFPDRPGPIARFTLNLDLDPAWQPTGEFQSQYSAGPLAPGQGFVLNVPLRYSASGAPVAIDARRPTEIVVAVVAIFGVLALLVLAFIARERSLGRFAPVDVAGIDGGWIENNILAYPAEVVGAAWDGRIGTSEVVALIARMTAEGKLESKVEGKDSMRLSLKVDRARLNSHERALVDGLFFDQRTEASTKEVQKHYRSKGFDPAAVIRPLLNEHVKEVVPPGGARVGRLTGIALFIAGVVLIVWSAYSVPELAGAAVVVAMVSLFLGAILQIPGWLFRARVDWGLRAAALLLLPALFVCLGTARFLWRVAGTGEVELPWTMVGALSAFALCIANGSINGMKSRQSIKAIAFRKRLATGRNFFLKELEKPRPNLRDGWYPWLLAFGLGKQVDVWSSHHIGTTTSSSTWDHSSSHSSSSSSSTNTGANTGWSGGGGLSGGAGASGAWAAAAAGMAAGVAAPGSSGSSGSGSSSSSSGGSSGGGGGGGW